MRGTARLLLARLGLQKLDVHVGSIDAEEAAFSLIHFHCRGRRSEQNMLQQEDVPTSPQNRRSPFLQPLVGAGQLRVKFRARAKR